MEDKNMRILFEKFSCELKQRYGVTVEEEYEI